MGTEQSIYFLSFLAFLTFDFCYYIIDWTTISIRVGLTEKIMKGLIIPSLVILATGFVVEMVSADPNREATTAECNQVVQVIKNKNCRDVDRYQSNKIY
ncbi:hypothetical protein C7H19_12095 [Aphanothece hegewaldii CCALA 016]|uniref:Uncharacterized protein n=2 Tax=Aphanothece TaxID=1121 RepID=A0A2T1LXT6_9CHRO|nr:hypothetical protein C7H19_12095 [Aphanothece hegewaldii CCALA 016]